MEIADRSSLSCAVVAAAISESGRYVRGLIALRSPAHKSPTHVSAALASGLRVLEVCIPRLRVSLALRVL
jgi:hypothetical protein